MIPAFAQLFTGELAIYGDRLVLSTDEPPPSPGSDLVDAARLSQLLASFTEQHYPGGDRRAVASLWAKHHFAALLPPFLALALIAEREINLSLEAIGCTFSPDGTTKRFHLRDAGRPAAAADAFARFTPLIDGHLEPLIRALSNASGVSRKVLWSNAGNVFDVIVRRIERAIGPRAPVSDALTLMASRHVSDGRPNPLFGPVRYHDRPGSIERLRRVCCIRYLIPDLGYCAACPLPAAKASP